MFCALALALAAPAASQAASADSSARVSIPVRVSGLDLTQPADAALMIRRLDAAALEACGASKFSLREYRQAVRESACYRDGMNDAVAQLGSPTVNALYRNHPVAVASN
jgi:UrcA family protein